MTSSKPILVFDLDDTLFNELDYVRSGLNAVASYMSQATGIKTVKLIDALTKSMLENRSYVFNRAFLELDIYNKKLVKKCITVYRLHHPKIKLFEEADECLKRYSKWNKFIVTDGNINAQSRKIQALGLKPKVIQAYLTYQYGHKHAKPSPYCFTLIAKRTGREAREIVYIADNPTKDFLGIKPLGFRTIRVLTGQHRCVSTSRINDAEITINDLTELTENLIKNLLI